MKHRPYAVRGAGAGGLLAALLLTQAPALCQMTKDQCVESNARAQHLRTDGKLAAARDQLRRCADPSCPALVRSDCTKRLDDLENAQPTIAFEAKTAGGADLIAVKVTMDGTPLADKLDGAPLPVDPGQHVFTLEAAGLPSVTRTLVVTQGEKGRRESIVFDAVASPPPSSPGVPPAQDAGARATEPASTAGGGDGAGTLKVFGLVAGGIGLASLAVGGVFGALTLSQKSQQEDVCGSPCSATSHAQALSDHATGMTDAAISTVGFIAGGALLIGGAVLYFTAGPSRPANTGLRLAPSLGPGGGGMSLRGEF